MTIPDVMPHLDVLIPPQQKPQNQQTDIQKIIQAWKLTKNIPIEGEESKRWNQVFFPRYSKTAKNLLLLFGYEHAVRCIEFVCEHMESKGMDYTFETVLKRSDLYREQMDRSRK